MKNSSLLILVVCLVVFSGFLLINQVLAQDTGSSGIPPNLDEEILKSFLPYEATGTSFEVSSPYFPEGLTIQSSESIHLVLTAVTSCVFLYLEPSKDSTNKTETVITISGLAPLWNNNPTSSCWRYQDGRPLELIPNPVSPSDLGSGGNGTYTWTQDLSQHHIALQPQHTILYIDKLQPKPPYYDYNPTTKTFTLLQDIEQSIYIMLDGITLDGGEYSVDSIYLYSRTNITITDSTVFNGIFLGGSSYVNIIDNTIMALDDILPPYYGGIGVNFGFPPPSHITIAGNDIKSCLFGIFYLGGAPPFGQPCHDITITDNKIYSNYVGAVIVGGFNITLTNNLVALNEWYGVQLSWCDNNAISENTIVVNSYGLYLAGSTNSTVYHNNLYGNQGYSVSSIEEGGIRIPPWDPTLLTPQSIELSYQGEGNWWGRACPGPLFIPEVDSHALDVVDSYPYATKDAWLEGLPPGCDTTPPVTQATVTPAPNPAGWHKSDVTVTLIATDPEPLASGVKEIHYQIAPEPEIIVSGDTAVISLTTESIFTISYYAVDNADNQSETQELVVRIDKTQPVITIISPAPQDYLNLETITIDFSLTDTLAGVKNYQVYLDDSQFLDGVLLDQGVAIPLINLLLGEYILKVMAFDKADNQGEVSVTFRSVSPAQAVTAITTDIQTMLADPGLSKKARKELEDALEFLIGQNDGQANNGALDKLADGDLIAAFTKIWQTIKELAKAEQLGAPTQPIQKDLCNIIKEIIRMRLEEAEAIYGADHPDVIKIRNAYDEGVALYNAGEYADAAQQFKFGQQWIAELDNYGPVITFITPQPDQYLNNPQPEIHAIYTDRLTAIRKFSVQVWIDGIDYTASAVITLGDLTLIPPALAEGMHTLTVSVNDVAEPTPNNTTVSLTFYIDLTPPLISIDRPAEGITMATFTDFIFEVIYSDALSGVDPQKVKIILNGTDVTGFFEISATGAWYQAKVETIDDIFNAQGLRDILLGCPNTLEAVISDKAGNVASLTGTFYATPAEIILPVVLTTPIPEPVKPVIRIAKQTPQAQQGIVTRCADKPLKVIVTKSPGGDPFPGISLNFATTDTDASFLETDIKTVTNKDGLGGVVYVYGKITGTYTVTVTVLGYEGVAPVEFSLESHLPKIEIKAFDNPETYEFSEQGEVGLPEKIKIKVIDPVTEEPLENVAVELTVVGHENQKEQKWWFLPFQGVTDSNGKIEIGFVAKYYIFYHDSNNPPVDLDGNIIPDGITVLRAYLPEFKEAARGIKRTIADEIKLTQKGRNRFLIIPYFGGQHQRGVAQRNLGSPLEIFVARGIWVNGIEYIPSKVEFKVIAGDGLVDEEEEVTRTTSKNDGRIHPPITYTYGPEILEPQIIEVTEILSDEKVYFVAGPPEVEILNPTAPTYEGTANDSDDFFVKGEEAEQKVLNEVKIWYEITSPANPTKVTLKIKAVRIKDGKVEKEVVRQIDDLPKVTGINCATWDGKNDKGKFIEDWLFTTQIEAYFTTPDPVKSNLHRLTELSGKHKPKIFLHEKEFCGPIYFDSIRIRWLDENSEHIKGEGVYTSLELLIDRRNWRDNYYFNFWDFHRKGLPIVRKMVFSRGKVQDNLAFVQYWMFYPSSTWPTDNAKEADVFHEGDWEMMQVAVKIDKEAKKLIPEGATASQHYWGQTRLWNNVETSCKYNPVIYIASGSHATFFTPGVFDSRLFGRELGFVTPNDHTAPTRRITEQYTLQPFEPMAPAVVLIKTKWWPWPGQWGEHGLYWYAPQRSSGPPSPKDTERDAIRIFDNPKTFYDVY